MKHLKKFLRVLNLNKEIKKLKRLNKKLIEDSEESRKNFEFLCHEVDMYKKRLRKKVNTEESKKQKNN